MVIEWEGRYGIPKYSMESIREFLVYVSRKYRETNPYLKGVSLTLDSYIPYMFEEVWRLIG